MRKDINGRLVISIRNTDLYSFNRQRKLLVPTCSSLEMADIAMELFKKNYRWDNPIRSIGVRGAGLIEAAACDQTSLFFDDKQRQKREHIDRTVDLIRSQYGYLSIQRAAIYADAQLSRVCPREHIVHPVGFFGT